MMKRLQVLLDAAELREVQATARRNRLTTAAWVRRALRETMEREAPAHPRAKLAAIRRARGYAFPIGDIDAVLAEVERGYLGDPG